MGKRRPYKYKIPEGKMRKNTYLTTQAAETLRYCSYLRHTSESSIIEEALMEYFKNHKIKLMEVENGKT